MADETRYLHKPCGEHVLTKRGDPWKSGDVLILSQVLWHFADDQGHWFQPEDVCPKCGGPVEPTSRTENGIMPEIGYAAEPRRLRIVWSCSNQTRHKHRWRWSAWVCGRIQWFFVGVLKNAPIKYRLDDGHG